MLLQRTLFTGPRAWVNQDLYARNCSGNALRARHHVTIDDGAALTTNTYFGRFAASYWQRWTRVTAVEVTGTISADPNVHTTILVRASDIGGHERTIGEAIHEGSDTFSLTVPLNSFHDGGSLWLEFTAREGKSRISDVEWHSLTLAPATGSNAEVAAGATGDENSQDAVANSTYTGRRFAIAVCTFNRPVDCTATLSALANDSLVRTLIDELYVTDQGTQHVCEQTKFQEAAETFGSILHYIQQPNLGGAGGFTRGIFEATEHDTPVDVLLMDDDVRVEPETVVRMRSFAALTRTPTIVGAQMMFLFNPDFLLASAEGVDLRSLRRGTLTDPHGITNTSMVDGELPERRLDAEYNGWWSCLIPSEAVHRMGLPMPFFFQWDDVEYSLRGRRHNIPTVTLPGAAVWHADFYWKDVDGFGHFFSMRNGLITAALEPGFDPKALAKNTLADIRREILGMQYGLAYTHMAAVRGFLRGPEGLHDGGQDAVARINKDRAEFPETRPTNLDDVPPVARVGRTAPPPAARWEKAVMLKRILKAMFNKRIPGPTIVPYEDAAWWNTSLYQDVYVTDASQAVVRRRAFKRDLHRQQTHELDALIRRFKREANDVAKQYQDAFGELTSRANWERLYGKN